MDRPRRWITGIERDISEIKEDDIRVRLLGTVVTQTGIIMIDDGTGMIKINTEESLSNGDRVLVIGRVSIKTDGQKEIDAEIVKMVNEIDIDLYKEVKKLKKQIGKRES